MQHQRKLPPALEATLNVLYPVLAVFSLIFIAIGGVIVAFGQLVQMAATLFEAGPGFWDPQRERKLLLVRNRLAALGAVVQHWFTIRQKKVTIIIACVDARIRTWEISGDTRGRNYVFRTPGSVMDEATLESVVLLIHLGVVRHVVATKHDDCAAEAAMSDPANRLHFPSMAQEIQHDSRRARVRQLVEHPRVAHLFESGEVVLTLADLDTHSGRLVPATSLETW